MLVRRLLWISGLLCFAAGTLAQSALQQVRVGVFQADPLNYMDENGKARGLNPDLLREIALQRGRWRPDFVPVTWAEGLEMLQTEELDLMVSVTYTDERAEVMDFSKVPVLEVWSQVYVPADAAVASVLDLHGCSVGIMKRGIHGRNFIHLAEAFGLDYEIREYDAHADIFEAVARGEVDAGVAPNHFGMRHAVEYNVVETAVQFSPAPIFFAAKKGRHADVLADIDAVMLDWKKDQNSYYYWRFDYWFGAERWARGIPLWLKLFFGVTVVSSSVFLILSAWFRREVKIRTRQLEENKDRLQEAQRIARLGRWDMDFSTGRVEWSSGMFEILGLDPDEDAGSYTDIMRFVHPDDRELLDKCYMEAVEQHKRYELQHRIVLGDGTMKWVYESGECDYDAAGKPLHAYGTTQDITSQVEAMQAYKKSSERLRLATQAGQVGIWEYDLGNDQLIWDDQMFRIYGMKPEKFSGKFDGWRQAVHPDDLEKTEADLERAIKERISYESEFRIITEGLHVKHIRVLAEVEYDASGKPDRVFGTSWDVTQQRRMVEALTSSERDYRLLFENMTTGFMLLEVLESTPGMPEDFKIIQVNAAAAEMTSMKRYDLIGQPLKEVLYPLEQNWVDMLCKVSMTQLPSAFESPISSLSLIASAWIFPTRPGFLGIVISDNTARRTAEEAVKSAQQQLQHIFDNSSDVIFKTDGAGNFTYMNSAAEELAGYPVHELLGKNMLDLVMPEHRAQMQARLQSRFDGRSEPGSFYFEMQSRDGRKIILEIATTALFGSDGKLEAIHGIARDVTERIEAERELEESRHFLRTIIDTIPARVFWKDKESVYLGCNAAFAADAGLDSPDEIIGQTDYDLSWAESEARLYRADDREVMTEQIERINYEEPQTHTDGVTYWLSTSKVPIRDADGEVIGVLGAYQDITARKVLEGERARLTTAISQSAEAIVIMDLKGVIQYVNPAFETVTGYSQEEALGQSLSIIKSGRHDARFYARIWKTIESGESWNGRIINKHRNGSFYTAETAISPVKGTDGAIENYVAAIGDVSRQVELEEHMRQAQKMDAVGRLAGGVAHDFNNILQSILGFSGILMGELDEDSSQYEDVSEIRNAARRAGDLTRQLLTLSRKHNVEYAVQDLNAIIRSNKKMMRRLIGEHIEFSYMLDPELKPIRADLSQIEQIILNLFINARDAMPDGGTVQVATYNVNTADEITDSPAGRQQQICLEVADSGHGIREDVREHLFEPFFTTKQVGEGTGLGLSVVYGIVQQHGGHIDVSSTVGSGAVFRVYLPVSLDAFDESDFLDLSPQGDEHSVAGNGERILVVEDDAVLRELSRRMLTDAGYTVDTASSLKESTELGENNAVFDLILADIILPDGNGLDLARRLTQNRSGTAVLLCSGYSHDPEVHDTIRVLGFRYLEKPIGSMQMLQTVREMLDETRSV